MKHQSMLVLALAVAGGFAGGAVSSRLLAPQPASAQGTPDHARVVRAGRFELVDKAGRTRASFEGGEVGGVLRSHFVEAQSFNLTDGKNIRGWLNVQPDGRPMLMFFDKKGVLRLGFGLEVRGGAAGDTFDDSGDSTEEDPRFWLVDRKGTTRVQLSVGRSLWPGWAFGEAATEGVRGKPESYETGAELSLFSPNGGMPAFMTDAGILGVHHGPLGSTLVDGASIRLLDQDGFRARLGLTSLETPTTGTKNQTSAASLVLFNKGGHVIWSAP